jgi:hypothetical protein
VRVTSWRETDSLLLSRDCFVEIGDVTQTLKPVKEGASEAVETSRLVGVTIWSEMDSLLLSRDRFIEVGNVTQTLKPTL